jgi:serine/threonine protein kinase/Tfp pilus assembly protein PilF
VAITCPKCHSENPETKQFCADCGTQLISTKDISSSNTETLQTPIREIARGATLAGRYEIIEELGKGGMGRVYKVFDTDIKEKVALKLLKPEIASDRETIERFSNELRFARKISHRNVCRMYDLGKAEGARFITMEYVSGEDLKSMIRMSTGFTVGTVLSIGKQVCDGLAEAHSLGVVHRDLKPQNIMIDKGGNAKIMDFGIARSIREKGITGPSILIGTPEYMSPEQAEAKEVDYRSDIYSLGIILYEMATGRVPFEGDTALSIAMKHKGEIPKDPKQLNPNLPEDLSGVILKCMEKDKAKRYQTAAEVRSELEKIEKGIPTTERVVPEKRPFTSHEITVKFSPKRLLVPILGLVALIIAGLVIWKVIHNKSAPDSAKSIAVLPFVNMSADKDDEYFSDGMTEELINALSKVKGLRVAARTSSFVFKGKTENISNIGQQLHVNTILEGSFRKAGNKLRITAQLINVASGFQFWSDTYERETQDVFAIQDEISRAIVSALKIELVGEQGIQLTKRYTENNEAYLLYLKGLFFWNKRTEEGLKKAIEQFDEALEVDPNYALAYAGLADSYDMLGSYVFLPPQEAVSKVKWAATKALEIDDTLAEAYASLGFAKCRFEWDWSGSEKDFKRAINLNASYATAHHWYGDLLEKIGRFDESIIETKRALTLDPLSLPINTSLGSCFKAARQYDQAIEQCKKAIEIDPSFSWAHSILAQAYLQKSMSELAISEFQKAVDYSGRSLEDLPQLANAYAVAGKKDEALNILEELNRRSKQTYVSGFSMALLYNGLGEKDKALEFLEKAYGERDGALCYLKYDLRFDNIRSDPRFQALLKKMNFK